MLMRIILNKAWERVEAGAYEVYYMPCIIVHVRVALEYRQRVIVTVCNSLINVLTNNNMLLYLTHQQRNHKVNIMYAITEKLAYSKAGKLVATLMRNTIYKDSRIHWVQQAMADMNFKKLG